MSKGGLIRTTLGNRRCNDNEKVEGDPERCYGKDHQRDGEVDLPKITRERATEQEQGSLEHQRQRPHHMVKVPRDDATQLLLSTVAAFNGRPSHAR